jgi:hypothetical protein
MKLTKVDEILESYVKNSISMDYVQRQTKMIAAREFVHSKECF